MIVSLWRRPLIFIPALLALCGMAYGAAWLATAAALQDQVQRWIDQQRDAGFTVTHEDVFLSGFPGRTVVTFPRWSMSRPDAWSWRTDAINLSSEPWRPNRFTVDLSGDHEISGMWTPLAILSAQRADIRPTLALDGQIDELTLTMENLMIGGKDASPVVKLAGGAVSITRAADQGGAAARLSLSMSDVAAPGLSGFNAAPLRTLRLTADLTGVLTSEALPSALAAWREGGGTLEVRELYLDWPPLTISGNGTLALDEQLQPIGAMTAKFTGFFETVDALTERGLVRTADASMVRIVLGILARTPEKGGPAEINLAVTAQNGKLYAGPLPLMALPAVAWPDDLKVP